MKTTDAVIDRIRQRREKLERAGILKRDNLDTGPTRLNFWLAQQYGPVRPSPDHPPVAQFALDLIAIPTGKFLPNNLGELQNDYESEHIRSFGHLEDVPDHDPVVYLIDAPDPPPALMQPIERVPDAVIATGFHPNAATKHKAVRPDEIDKEAVLTDLAAYHKAHPPKRRTREEIDAEIAAVLEELQPTKPNVARPVALPPTGRK